jgi:hypothetical protein
MFIELDGLKICMSHRSLIGPLLAGPLSTLPSAIRITTTVQHPTPSSASSPSRAQSGQVVSVGFRLRHDLSLQGGRVGGAKVGGDPIFLPSLILGGHQGV